MRLLLLILIACLLTLSTAAQTTTHINLDLKKRNNNHRYNDERSSIYFEVGGTLLGTSVNFEQMFLNKRKFKMGTRVGLGVGLELFESISVCSQFKTLIGNGSHFYEAGIGVTFVHFENIYLNSQNGYRFQPENRRYFLAAKITTSFEVGRLRVRPWPGISYGIRF